MPRLNASLALWLALAPAPPAMAETLMLPSRAGEVPFSHRPHFGGEGDCVVCHHESRPPARMQPCRDCHDGPDGSVLSARDAFHGSCIGCHHRLLRAGQDTGPARRCSGCHAPSGR
jgi:hypothetical protein